MHDSIRSGTVAVATGLAVIVSTLAVPAARACLHGPESFRGEVGQARQEAIVFWSAGREELILRNTWQLRPDEGQALPVSLAWVIPVPTEPDAYGEVDPGVFEALYEHYAAENDLHRDAVTGRFRGVSRVLAFDSEEGGGVELLAPVTAGRYEIQPVRATGEDGAAALNDWLTGNGFGAVPLENARYYVEREWVWLCVRVNAGAEASLDASGTWRPLRISFASEEIVYPLKFSTHQGEFELQLWVVTDAPPTSKRPEPEEDGPEENDDDGDDEQDGFEGGGEMDGDDLDDLDDGVFFDQTDPFEGLPDDLYGEGRYMPLPHALDALQLTAEKEGRYASLDNRVGVKVPYVSVIRGYLRGEDIALWETDLALRVGEAPRRRHGADEDDAPIDPATVVRGPDAPVLAEVLAERAGVHARAAAWDEALATWDRYIENDPSRVRSGQRGRAEALHRLGRQPEALAALERAMAEIPGRDAPSRARVEACLRLRAKAEIASGAFEAALATVGRLKASQAGKGPASLSFDDDGYAMGVAALEARAHIGLGDAAAARRALGESEDGLGALLVDALAGKVDDEALLATRWGGVWALTLGDAGTSKKALAMIEAAAADLSAEIAALSKELDELAGEPDVAAMERVEIGDELASLKVEHDLSLLAIGRIEGAALLARIDALPPHRRGGWRTVALGQLGLRAEREGNAELARKHYDACLATVAIGTDEYLWALGRRHLESRE